MGEDYLPIGTEKNEQNKKGFANKDKIAELEQLYQTRKKTNEPQNTAVAKEEPKQNAQPEPPVQEQSNQPTIAPLLPPISNEPRPSFDQAINDFLEKQFEQIDNDALTKKDQVVKNFNAKLQGFFNSMINGSVPTQQPSQQQMDHSEEIIWLNTQIIDPTTTNTDKSRFLRRKRFLEGKPFTVEDEKAFSPNSSKLVTNEPKEKSKNDISKKTAIVLFFGVFGITALIFLFGLHIL